MLFIQRSGVLVPPQLTPGLLDLVLFAVLLQPLTHELGVCGLINFGCLGHGWLLVGLFAHARQAFDFLDSLDRIDISSKESLANAMYEEGYVTEDCLKANDIMIIKEMLGNPYDKHNLNFILNNVTLFTDAGVKDLYEAIELSKKVNSSQHSDLVINIEQIRILSGLAYGREFKSTNGGLIKQISNALRDQ